MEKIESPQIYNGKFIYVRYDALVDTIRYDHSKEFISIKNELKKLFDEQGRGEVEPRRVLLRDIVREFLDRNPDFQFEYKDTGFLWDF